MASDETRPLLDDQNSESQDSIPAPTPIPKVQLAALCTVRLVDPVAFTQLFPYVNEFMSDLRLTDDPSRIGFYSGLVESAFSLSQLVSIYPWARLSDVIGRRPVILVGIFGTAVTTLVFGLSKSLASVLIARCIGGLFSGNVAVIHSLLGEITDPSNQADVFPIYGIMYPIGTIIGPLIGGSFSHPADKYPQFFNTGFWKEYPYLLPCLTAAIIAIIGVALGYAFLEETLPSKRKQNGEKHASVSYGVRNAHSSIPVTPDKPMDLRQLLALPIIRALATSGFALCFLATAFDVVFVLFCYSPVHSGGLSFSSSQIGYALAAAGTIAAAFQLFIMSYLLRTFDCAKMYNFCMGLWPYAYTVLPILNVIARSGIDEGTGQLGPYTTAALWTGIAIALTLARAGTVAYGLSMLLIKANSPSPGSLGRSNGVVQFAMCSARSFAPFFVSSLFALSIDYNLLGGYLWVVIMGSLSYFSTTISRQISLHSKRTIP
ncbi:major facilitator superfamily domain-containing protein [Boletus reticuloceps]|uniref:Major facilitator superfamily domain-containing protein n=1 Tax=Boletus reticuloceps TaxID=495285 RepID=A0A8I3ABF9_9AGAM|nr:major facilitator superfamily domain-containing protein [Boletus reticuloceps]